MKTNVPSRFIAYMYSNFAGNFLGFVIGMASTKLVAHFFTTRSLKNFWGLTAKKTVVDKQTFHAFEWMISIIVGFIVFEIISKWIKKKIDEYLPKYKLTRWMAEKENADKI
jgi:undecaprenyl pyrophosphate phosphatase UppP